MPSAILIPHPASHSASPTVITVEYERRDTQLWLRFIVEGDPDLIQWPRTMSPGRADELWKQTCFEAFVSTDGGYREFNLSPSGQWASYRFTGYREGMGAAEETVFVDGLDGGSDYVALEGRIDLPDGADRLGFSAVIEDIKGDKTYWALAHPSDKPDFHHPDSFTLVLPAPEPAGNEMP
ncbi:MAG: DOMON-like domain-containing protein [Brevundimonas sp.]|uniref:DOMON-like domain-containing protein n=1 Tax=Brevundimonas sp. TaxID=1871086 RepID=UPI0040339647